MLIVSHYPYSAIHGLFKSILIRRRSWRLYETILFINTKHQSYDYVKEYLNMLREEHNIHEREPVLITEEQLATIKSIMSL